MATRCSPHRRDGRQRQPPLLFRNMFPGTYTLTETQPPNLIDGRDRAGTLGGVVGNDVITNIPVDPPVAGTLFEFGELGLNDPSKFWLLSNTDLSQVVGPPGSGVTDVNPGPADLPPGATGAGQPGPGSAGDANREQFVGAGVRCRSDHPAVDPRSVPGVRGAPRPRRGRRDRRWYHRRDRGNGARVEQRGGVRRSDRGSPPEFPGVPRVRWRIVADDRGCVGRPGTRTSSSEPPPARATSRCSTVGPGSCCRVSRRSPVTMVECR